MQLFISIITLCFFISCCTSQLVPAAYTFGDSTLDAGNNNYLETVFKADFLPYGRDFDTKQPTGRFTNGRTSADLLGTLLSLPLALPYLDPQAKGSKIVTGVNFATGGSGLLEETGAVLNVPGLKGQLEWFKNHKNQLIQVVGQKNASSIISQALFTLSTGSNDYVSNYYLNPLLQHKYDASAFRQLLIQQFQDFTKSLYNLGVRRIAVVSLAPLGCLPSQVTLYGKGSLNCIDFPNRDAQNFNKALNSTVSSLNKSLKGLKLAYIDIYSVLEDAVKNPKSNGFKQTTTGCCGVGRLAVSILCNQYSYGTCKNASEYIFFDSVHPTTAMNQLIANAALVQGVPQLL